MKKYLLLIVVFFILSNLYSQKDFNYTFDTHVTYFLEVYTKDSVIYNEDRRIIKEANKLIIKTFNNIITKKEEIDEYHILFLGYDKELSSYLYIATDETRFVIDPIDCIIMIQHKNSAINIAYF